MASQSARCAEARRLFTKYVTAVSEYLLLESEAELLRRGEVSPHAAIEAAWNRREKAKREAIEHRFVHGCGTILGEPAPPTIRRRLA
jgi:hypothetical protein